MITVLLRTIFTKPVGPFILAEAFRASLLAYLLLLLIEYLVPGAASHFLPMTAILVIVLASGVGAALFPEPTRNAQIERRKPRLRDYLFIAILSLVGAVLIYAKTQNIGRIAIGIAILSGVIIALLSLLLLLDDGEDEKSERG